jgi:hypothetical protein
VRVESEQCLNFRAHFARDLTILEMFFPLIRRKVGKLVEKTLNLAFQLVVPTVLEAPFVSEESSGLLQA